MERFYYLCFSRVRGIGRARLTKLLSFFGSLEASWRASYGELKEAGLEERVIYEILRLRDKVTPEGEAEELSRKGIDFITIGDDAYPWRLKEIPDAPIVLYIKGRILPEDEWALCVVGTRRATSYGRSVCERIVPELSRSGLTIVSGLAHGIDSYAHRACLSAGGRTIAVLGSGLDIIYPKENEGLAREIEERGALLSEFPPGTKPYSQNFPRRNRIMSGLSLGVLVVEGDVKSGAMITARFALEQDREVFAVPGNIFSPSSSGTNRLIQEGAKLVMSARDILEEINLDMALRREGEVPSDERERRIMEVLSEGPLHIDEVAYRSGMSINEVSSVLSIMEVKGMVKEVGGMNFIRV